MTHASALRDPRDPKARAGTRSGRSRRADRSPQCAAQCGKSASSCCFRVEPSARSCVKPRVAGSTGLRRLV